MRYLLTMITMLAACDGTSPSEELVRCQQTYEFGNYGCADLSGGVHDTEGRPISGAYVRVLGPVDRDRSIEISFPLVQTSADGSYRFRVLRISGDVAGGVADTVSVWVRAVVAPDRSLPIGTPGPSDSVRALLRFQPVGAIAAEATVPDIAVELLK